MHKLRISLLFLTSLLSGCGDDSVETESTPTEKSYTMIVNIEETRSDGAYFSYQTENKYSYKIASNIPNKYTYSGSIPGPYDHQTISIDEEETATSYRSLEGELIIFDNFKYYTTKDHSTVSESTTSSELSKSGVGFVYDYEDLYLDSESNEIIGNGTAKSIIEVIGTEIRLTSTGRFEFYKVKNTFYSTTSVDGETTYTTTTEYSWIDKASNRLIASQAESTYRFSFSSLTIDQNRRAEVSHTTMSEPLSNLNSRSLLNQSDIVNYDKEQVIAKHAFNLFK